MKKYAHITDHYDLPDSALKPLYLEGQVPFFTDGEWDKATEDPKEDPPDPLQAERHARALTEAMTKRAARAGFPPWGHELIYWLHIGDAANNADAIKRWITLNLKVQPELSFEDKIIFVEDHLKEILAEAA